MTKNLERDILEIEKARQHREDNLNVERISALNRRDAVKYFGLCNYLGIEPEDLSLYEVGSLESNENVLDLPKRDFSSKGRVSKSTYAEFFKRTSQLRIRPYNLSADSDEKRRLLVETMRYKQLKTSYGYEPIEQCTDLKIGQAFKKIYEAACGKLGFRH